MQSCFQRYSIPTREPIGAGCTRDEKLTEPPGHDRFSLLDPLCETRGETLHVEFDVSVTAETSLIPCVPSLPSKPKNALHHTVN